MPVPSPPGLLQKGAFMDVTACHRLSYGLYIVTSLRKGERNGQIVNTVFQVTSEPVRIVASICKDNLTHEYIEESAQWFLCCN